MPSILRKSGQSVALRPNQRSGPSEFFIAVSLLLASAALVWMVPEKLFSVYSWGAGYSRLVFLLHLPIWFAAMAAVLLRKDLQSLIWTVPVFTGLPTVLVATEIIGIVIFGTDIRWSYLVACSAYIALLVALMAISTGDRRRVFRVWCYTLAAQFAPSIVVAYLASLNLIC